MQSFTLTTRGKTWWLDFPVPARADNIHPTVDYTAVKSGRRENLLHSFPGLGLFAPSFSHAVSSRADAK